MIKEFVYPFLQRTRKLPYIVTYNFFRKAFNLDTEKIVLASNTRKELSGNLLYIYNYLVEHNSEKEIKVVTKEKENILYNFFFQLKCAKEMANSKYIIIDDYFPLVYTFNIRENAKLIQVWHACGAFKKIGNSRKNNSFCKYTLTHKNYTDAIVSSESIRKNYAEAFDIDIKKVHALGVPRTDMFFDEKIMKKKNEELLKKLGIGKEKRIILFAPTFRGNNVKKAYYPENFIKIEEIYNNLREEDIFIIKMHPFIKNKIKVDEKFKDKIMNITDEYREINDLLLITDLLITDYSSVIFEYSFFDKPVIFYIPDYDEYKKKRDFYYEFYEYTYGMQIYEFKQLLENLNYKEEKKEKINIFREKFLNKCDGKSTERIIKEIIK